LLQILGAAAVVIILSMIIWDHCHHIHSGMKRNLRLPNPSTLIGRDFLWLVSKNVQRWPGRHRQASGWSDITPGWDRWSNWPEQELDRATGVDRMAGGAIRALQQTVTRRNMNL